MRRRAKTQTKTITPFDQWLPRVTPQWSWDWLYQRYIQTQLDRVDRGEIKRLMLFVPPRHGKSEMVTVRHSVWRLERNPGERIIIGAYSQILANKFSRKIKRIAERRISLAKDRRAVEDWETAQGGGLRAVGVGAGITGQGGNLIVIDDPVKNRQEAESPAYCDRVWDWYRDDLYTRLEPNAAMILIMTRWTQDDLAGRILASEDAKNWTLVTLPALAEKDDPLGREIGQALCPERYDEAALHETELVLGPYSFAALYQQRPTPLEGALFKREYFRNIVDRAPDGLQWVRYWDLAASTKTSADFTASAAAALADDGTLYIRDMVRDRWEWPDAAKVMKATMLAERGHTGRHGIEKALHGIAAIQTLLRDEDLANVAFTGIDVDRDKLTRALPFAARAQAGKVMLVRGSWNMAFIDECCAFTGNGSTHDDQVDSISGGLQMIAAGDDTPPPTEALNPFGMWRG